MDKEKEITYWTKKVLWNFSTLTLAFLLLLFIFIFSIDSSNGTTVVSIPDKYKVIAPGDEILVETILDQFRFNKKTDVVVNYEVKDQDMGSILKQHQTVAIETQASFLKTIDLPQDIPTGRYTLFNSIQNLDSTILATANTSFEVAKPSPGYSESKNIFIITHRSIVVLCLIAGLTILLGILLMNKKKVPTSPHNIKEKNISYRDLVETIVKQNSFFGGDKSITLANEVKGLSVSQKGDVIKMCGNGLETIKSLIRLYRLSIGEGSINITRHAIRDLIIQNPKLKIPTELK